MGQCHRMLGCGSDSDTGCLDVGQCHRMLGCGSDSVMGC